MWRLLKRLFRRKVSVESSIAREELRKIGLVLIGAGIATAGVSSLGYLFGIFVVAIGTALWLYGLTEPR